MKGHEETIVEFLLCMCAQIRGSAVKKFQHRVWTIKKSMKDDFGIAASMF